MILGDRIEFSADVKTDDWRYQSDNYYLFLFKVYPEYELLLVVNVTKIRIILDQ